MEKCGQLCIVCCCCSSTNMFLGFCVRSYYPSLQAKPLNLSHKLGNKCTSLWCTSLGSLTTQYMENLTATSFVALHTVFATFRWELKTYFHHYMFFFAGILVLLRSHLLESCWQDTFWKRHRQVNQTVTGQPNHKGRDQYCTKPHNEDSARSVVQSAWQECKLGWFFQQSSSLLDLPEMKKKSLKYYGKSIGVGTFAYCLQSLGPQNFITF